ncbi:MAG: hypothetical protein PF495_11810 [Spirochaetales bacterium]|jgi:hypothetical protein|nr:hypothetical protein [Spirochaetales bacterium]
MPAEITFRTVSPHDSAAIKAFIKFPKNLYADCPNYIAWLDTSMKPILQKTHPFFDNSQGEFLLCERNGKTAGRMALLEPVRFNAYQNKRDCRIYFFDLIKILFCTRVLIYQLLLP